MLVIQLAPLWAQLLDIMLVKLMEILTELMMDILKDNLTDILKDNLMDQLKDNLMDQLKDNELIQPFLTRYIDRSSHRNLKLLDLVWQQNFVMNNHMMLLMVMLLNYYLKQGLMQWLIQ
eukprot:797161_1